MRNEYNTEALEREELRSNPVSRVLEGTAFSAYYKPWFSITLYHEYYVKTPVPVLLLPSVETKRFFKKQDLIFLQQNATKWLVVRNEKSVPGEYPDEEDTKLSFEMYSTNQEFYYVSGNIVENERFRVKDPDGCAIWKKIEIDLEYMVNNPFEDLSVKITSVEKYQEYILIPKYCKSDFKIKMLEERDKVRFTDAERISLPEIPEAFRFVTAEKIRLTQGNDLKVRLWEIRESGERLLSDCIPIPRPDQCSILDPKNVLTTYFYY